MSYISNAPISLRRTRRSTQALREEAEDHASNSSEDHIAEPSPASATPRRQPRLRKKVRFSDPGPILASLEDELSTGLTPMIRRTSLASRTSRRHSTPSRLSRSTPDPASDEGSEDTMSTISEVHFLPLRQVLDGRVKRRIRRNGLSEEMNAIYAERKKRAQETKAEIDRLKAELKAKDEENHRMHDETVVVDTERVWNLEQQVEALQRELARRSGVQQQQTPSSPSYNWTMAARDPFSDDFMQLDEVDDDEAFGDATMADLVCSTPSRRARASFPTPPTTSPAAAPMTPRFNAPATPHSHIGVQADLPDAEKEQLESELASLQLEICKLTTTLESYTALQSRLSDKLSRFSPLTPPEGSPDAAVTPHSDIEGRLAMVLQMLSDRTAALFELDKSISGLGFQGSDASEIVASLSSAFRSARLELEYLSPGESTLPLTSAGAAILDLILDRLRDLAKKGREADDTIDEYHSIELSLRQQLTARVEAMDTLNKEVNRMEAVGREKDERIIDLEVGLERLKGAVQRYTRDVSELEGLVQRMERELEASSTERKQDAEAYEQVTKEHAEALAQKTSAISDLEAKLSTAVDQTSTLQAQLASVQAAHTKTIEDLKSSTKADIAKLHKTHGAALALRDARVAELRLEIDRVNEALRSAHETVRQLRVENGQLTNLNAQLTSENVELSSKMEVDKRKAKDVIDSMKIELERVVRMSEGFLAGTPKKPRKSGRRDSALGDDEEEEGGVSLITTPGEEGSSSKPGSLLSGDLAKRGRGKKRRRYDSGLGFLDEEEVA